MATRRKTRAASRTPDEQIAELEARIAQLRAQIADRKRFSPARVRRERARLELSAADYGELVGVSALTIYSWEKGRSEPRPQQLEAWLALVDVSRREAWERLGYE
jgi:DNA-binding transcriptional regulator YiaG